MTSEIINLLNFLLPGFIASILFYSLTSFPKKSEFESVIMALIYTVIINSFTEVLKWLLFLIGNNWFSLGVWSSTVKVLWSIFFALLFGLLLSYFHNNDVLHKFLRQYKITNQTSYPTEWYGTFSETRSYVILHFTDGRRIMGWPLEWPSSPKNGHFVLENAAWLIDGKSENVQEIELTNVAKIMLDATNINKVEFMKQKEIKNES